MKRTEIKRTPFTRTHAPDAIPREVRREVEARSGGRCEAGTEVCARRTRHLHHRKLRAQGGEHTAANLLHVCFSCHSYLHANPSWSYDRGLLVRSTDNPADVPVRKGITWTRT